MNITLIRATKRNNSSTYNAAKYLISRLHNAEEVYEFTLPEDMPHICCGCYACLRGDEERCGGYVYLKPILEAFSKSHLIVFCCPVWCFHAPGQVKSFLDHFGYRWLVHRPDFDMRNKQALIIATAGGGGMKSAARDIHDSMDYWGIARTHVITQAVWQYFWDDMPEKFKVKLIKKLDKAAAKIEKYEVHLTPSLKSRGLYRLFAHLHRKEKMWPLDDAYWKEKLADGTLEKDKATQGER